MTLTLNQIRIKAKEFAKEWEGETYEAGEAQSFYNSFFQVFGQKRRDFARFEEHIKKLNNQHGFIDLFWPGVLIAEHKSLGLDLKKAENQVMEYFDCLSIHERPRYRLVCDFQTFNLKDLDTDAVVEFKLPDLCDNIHHFMFMLGRSKATSIKIQKPVNEDAAKGVAKLYNHFKKNNYNDQSLCRLLTRIIFCAFADTTGIFQPRGIFRDIIENQTNENGANVGDVLADVFEALDTQNSNRQRGINIDINLLPLVNGALFADKIAKPIFDHESRSILLEIIGFDWSKISPTIFGRLLQAVTTKAKNADLSAFFTTEDSIRLILDNVILESLRDEFATIANRSVKNKEEIDRFRKKLSQICFLDPTCGAGNFLSVAYSELRKIELQAILHLKKFGIATTEDLKPNVNVNQLFGVELDEYFVRISEISLWMTDHLANNELSLELQLDYSRIPLKERPTILNTDSLSLDWSIFNAADSSEFVVIGNPPYKGSKRQSEAESSALMRVKDSAQKEGTLDYASAWIIKAASRFKEKTKIGFVITNSLTQGEQVSQFYTEILNKYKLEISFACQSFSWPDTKGNAPQVDVVIIGLSGLDYRPKIRKLYRSPSDAFPKLCSHISPYLIDSFGLKNLNTVVASSSKPINGLPKLRTGTKPIDGGYYILSKEERLKILFSYPDIDPYVCPFIGTEELLSGKSRYIINVGAIPNQLLSKNKIVLDLIAKVRQYRSCEIPEKKGDKRLKKPNPLFKFPKKFHITSIPKKPFAVIPEVTSERRKYLPIALFEPPVVPSNLVKYIEDPDLCILGFLLSGTHYLWMQKIGGHLEARNRYSINCVYNNFPLPEIHNDTKEKIRQATSRIFDLRKTYSSSSLKDLYNPDAMPNDICDAHSKLDKIIERIYFGDASYSDDEKLVRLLNLYNLQAARNP